MEQILRIVVGVSAGVILLVGSLLALGLAPVTKHVPKTHSLNRKTGLGLILLGLGVLGMHIFVWLDLYSTLPILAVVVIVVCGVLLVVLGSWMNLRTMRQIGEYRAEDSRQN